MVYTVRKLSSEEFVSGYKALHRCQPTEEEEGWDWWGAFTTGSMNRGGELGWSEQPLVEQLGQLAETSEEQCVGLGGLFTGGHAVRYGGIYQLRGDYVAGAHRRQGVHQLLIKHRVQHIDQIKHNQRENPLSETWALTARSKRDRIGGFVSLVNAGFRLTASDDKEHHWEYTPF